MNLDLLAGPRDNGIKSKVQELETQLQVKFFFKYGKKIRIYNSKEGKQTTSFKAVVQTHIILIKGILGPISYS